VETAYRRRSQSGTHASPHKRTGVQRRAPEGARRSASASDAAPRWAAARRDHDSNAIAVLPIGFVSQRDQVVCRVTFRDGLPVLFKEVVPTVQLMVPDGPRDRPTMRGTIPFVQDYRYRLPDPKARTSRVGILPDGVHDRLGVNDAKRLPGYHDPT